LAQRLAVSISGETTDISGIISRVSSNKSDIFEDIEDFEATSYHSLHVVLSQHLANGDKIIGNGTASTNIKPLAWDYSDDKNGTVLMAARHQRLPFWGVQYHPESICTTQGGKHIVKDWWRLAKRWIDSHNRTTKLGDIPQPSKSVVSEDNRQTSANLAALHLNNFKTMGALKSKSTVTWREFKAPNPDIIHICETFQIPNNEALVLQSGRLANGQPVNPELGRYSIIGLIDDASLRLQYSVLERTLILRGKSTPHDLTMRQLKESRVPDLWAYLQGFMQALKCESGSASSPFWGGLMGYISYEAGLQSISVPVRRTMESEASRLTKKPDVHFAYVARSIVIDHVSGMGWIQTTLPDDEKFLETTLIQITSSMQSNGKHNGSPIINGACRAKATHKSQAGELKLHSVRYPKKSDYLKQIQMCDVFIRKGDSYELCLTGQSKLLIQHGNQVAPGWSLFRRLSESNPSTFSAYMRLSSSDDSVTIVGSSPERFLSWNRLGDCQFRPIKGTVKKSRNVGLAEATKILGSSKEQAENLMITDLIRHDLHGIAGAGHVHVSKLMQIEEYATVFQLVSVIEGDLRPRNPRRRYSDFERKKPKLHGIDVLAASLPPGSMTGAPKKRSCEILLEIEEHKPRGIYSGVIGYLDVGGGGDFSVVIRTAYKWDSEFKASSGCSSNLDPQEWTIGAGGAITAQSNPDDEYQEMLVKLNSVLGAFDTQLKD
jgi:para-aminobenzoate synthetase